MALNSSKKKTPVLPELEKYYEAEKRERSGLAWLLAAISVAGVALVIIGIYFGGRTLYRNLTDDDEATVAVETSPDKTKDVTEVVNTKDGENKNVTNPSTPAPAGTTQANTATPTTTASTPATSTTPKVLVSTGVANLLPVFVVVTAVGAFAYRVKLLNDK